jgi:hypothetical protein
MIMGRTINMSKHTVVPHYEGDHQDKPTSNVVNYQLSEEELAKYRAMPSIKEKKYVFIIPMRKTM